MREISNPTVSPKTHPTTISGTQWELKYHVMLLQHSDEQKSCMTEHMLSLGLVIMLIQSITRVQEIFLI